MPLFSVVIQIRQIVTYQHIDADSKSEACKLAKDCEFEPDIKSDPSKTVLASFNEK